MHKIEEPVIYNAQYRELVALINYQRDKISSQQADLTKVILNGNNALVIKKLFLVRCRNCLLGREGARKTVTIRFYNTGNN